MWKRAVFSSAKLPQGAVDRDATYAWMPAASRIGSDPIVVNRSHSVA
jgi:hypothetical protein